MATCTAIYLCTFTYSRTYEASNDTFGHLQRPTTVAILVGFFKGG